MFFDMNYLWFVLIPTMLLSFGVQMYLRSTFAKWSGVRNSANLVGPQVAQALFSRTSLDDIPVQRVPGALTDHFDPTTNVVRLSDPVSSQASVAAMAVTAHELGHVQQYQSRSPLIAMRSFLIPAMRLSPTVSYFLIMVGLFMQLTGLLWAGILFFGVSVIFSLLTVPVEIDASRRGLILLREANLLQTQDDERGAKAVLTAAALTYIAALVTSVLTLLYYVNLAQRRG
ncbi:MAG: zinc metallopeptidase [Roseiflexaceae bacterium]|nr:zinc metallopeptidase [Roseiflexaceae bacterium]